MFVIHTLHETSERRTDVPEATHMRRQAAAGDGMRVRRGVFGAKRGDERYFRK